MVPVKICVAQRSGRVRRRTAAYYVGTGTVAVWLSW